MKYYIYKTTCLVNNKIYVGKHKSNDIENDEYLGSGNLLKYAIKKYGAKNFKREILFESDDGNKISDIEAEIVNEEFIARLDTYNIKLGGTGGFDYINENKLNIYENHHETVCKYGGEVLRQYSKIHNERLINDPEYYNEFRCKISNGLNLYFKNGGKPFFKDRKHSNETKLKIGKVTSKHQKGCGNSQYGTKWIYNEQLKISKRIKKYEEIPSDWKIGRKIKFS